MLKKGNCKKVKKPCKQRYSVKMINHKQCSIFSGGKIKAKAAKKSRKQSKAGKGKKASGKKKKARR